MSDNASTRRQFVRGALAGGAALGLGLRPSWAADVSGKPAAGKIGDFKISLAEWSLHQALFAKDAKITNLDFPRIAREEYGIDGVEFVNQFFKDRAHDSDYLKDLKRRADDRSHPVGRLSMTAWRRRDQGRPPSSRGRPIVEDFRIAVSAVG